MRHAFALVTRSALTIFLFSGAALFGWNDAAHRIVATAAQEHLSENALRRISYLAGKDAKLVDVAEWADAIIVERPEAEAWQSITIPPGASGVDLQRDCPLGECVTVKVRECIGIIRLAIRPRREILEAFKLLVGLSADMHHPLLSGYPPSQGPDDRIVVLGGEEMTLFDAWNEGLIAALGSEEEVLERVRKRITDADKEAWKSGTYESWTWETHRVAVDRIYPMVAEASGKTELVGQSEVDAKEIVIEQMAKAAVRLTHMLDDAWP